MRLFCRASRFQGGQLFHVYHGKMFVAVEQPVDKSTRSSRDVKGRMSNSGFWKEREEEFRRHSIGEHSSLAADWYSVADTWQFRGGTGHGSERIFRSVARKAARQLSGSPGADHCKVWLDALRHAEYNFEVRFKHAGAYNQQRRDYLVQSGETRPVVEGIDQTVSLPDNSVETRSLIEGITGTIERIFDTSADYCLELGSHAASDATTVTAAGKNPEVLRRTASGGDIELVRVSARKMIADGATHQKVCQRLKDANRPPRAEWRHLPWDQAYMSSQYRGAVCKWLSKNCRP